MKVVEKNEHLWLVISNFNQAEKNIDLNLQKGRGYNFSLLGIQIFPEPSYNIINIKNIHVPNFDIWFVSTSWTTTKWTPGNFPQKTLKSIIKLSISAPTQSTLHFLTGELQQRYQYLVDPRHEDLSDLKIPVSKQLWEELCMGRTHQIVRNI